MKAKKLSTAEKIRRELRDNTGVSTTDVAKKFGVRYQTVWTIKKQMMKKAIADMKKDGLRRNAQGKILMQRHEVQQLPVVGDSNEYEHKEGQWRAVPPADNVNHPAHYKIGGIETIDFIEAKQLNYHLGNVVKYIARAEHKADRMEDLCKARWYLNREIARLEGKK